MPLGKGLSGLLSAVRLIAAMVAMPNGIAGAFDAIRRRAIDYASSRRTV
jgi:hypothetical protein